MIYMESPSKDPAFNLALEQYMFEQKDRSDDFFMFWQNENSVIVGKNQNTIEEVNRRYVEEKGIHVVRRLSGGGAVYHDLGNLNFTFIVDGQGEEDMNLKRFIRLVAEALQKLGIKAGISGRNDILIDGMKFSGNAQYMKNDRIMHHGTLMFNSDLEELSKALRVSEDKIKSKGIKSIKSGVTNIADHLPEAMTLAEFKEHLLKSLFSDTVLSYYKLTAGDETRIRELRQNRYATWEWNYGFSPAYEIRKQRYFANCGDIQIHMNVANGRIEDFAVFGSYFGNRNTKELGNLLMGRNLNRQDIERALCGVQIADYFNGLAKQELIDMIII